VFDAMRLFAKSCEGWAEHDPRRVQLAVAFRLAQQADEGDVPTMKQLVHIVNDLVVFDIDRDPDSLDALKYLGLEEALDWIDKYAPGPAQRIRDAREYRAQV
jgi:hypothetical protein